MNTLQSIKLQIDKSSVISFDIFDTLLLRPYIEPSHLFFHLEKLENAIDYAKNRIQAEHKAWHSRKNNEDITFDEIYDYIDDKFKYMKQKEFDFEKKVLIQNPEMFEIYNYALSQNKKIIFVSDMYFPSSFLAEVLRQKGYSSYYKLYVSSDIGIRKSTSNLYKKIQKELNISYQEILHIGDNFHSDYTVPKDLGINAVYYEKVFERFLKENINARIFQKQFNNNIGVSILLSVLSIKWLKYKKDNSEENYWYKLGYEIGGPTCFAFMKFLEKDVLENNIKNLFFVARDGYSLEKVFKVFGNESIKTHYVYAPRFMNVISRLDFDSTDAMIIEQRKDAVIDYLKSKSGGVSTVNTMELIDQEQKSNFIMQNIEELKKLSVEEMSKYKQYLLEKKVDDSVIAVIDTITVSFSSQQLIAAALDDVSLMGYYFCALTEFDEYKNNKFKRFFPIRNRLKLGSFIEFLMTSPEKPIQRIENNLPVYQDNISVYENNKIRIYPFVSQGEIDFAIDIQQIFGKDDIFLTDEIIYNWLDVFAENPKKCDKKYFKLIRHGQDILHSDFYVDIFPWWYDNAIFLRHRIRRIIDRIKNCIQPPQNSD